MPVSLREFIVSAVRSNLIPAEFSAKDVKALAEKEPTESLAFDPKYTSNNLANVAAGRAGKPWVQRIGAKGCYCLSDSPQKHGIPDLEETGQRGVSVNNSLTKAAPSISDQIAVDRADAAKLFVEYLRESAFRLRMKNGRGFKWYPEDGPATGWQSRLDTYDWKTANWQKTEIRVNEFISALASLEKEANSNPESNLAALQQAASVIYRNIEEWGIAGASGGDSGNGEFVLQCLRGLWSGKIMTVNSTLTKLYAFARPDDFVIYDSRVAAAIIRIAEYMYPMVSRDSGRRYEDSVKTFHEAFPHLGKFERNGASGGRGGTRINENFRFAWPDSYTSCEAQLEANCLCGLIVDELNQCKEGGRNNWTLREVEAVLFMEGY